MTSERGTDMDVTRRSFVGGMGAAGVLAVAGAAPAPAVAEETSGTIDNTPVTGYQCSEDWLGQPPAIDPSEVLETVEAEVVVCGGGHAGCQCALAAAQQGAKVVLLEAQAKDTYTANGVDICGFNSKLLTDRGLGGYDTGEIVGEFVRRGAGRVNADIIRLFVENSGEMIDNLVAITPKRPTCGISRAGKSRSRPPMTCPTQAITRLSALGTRAGRHACKPWAPTTPPLLMGVPVRTSCE